MLLRMPRSSPLSSKKAPAARLAEHLVAIVGDSGPHVLLAGLFILTAVLGHPSALAMEEPRRRGVCDPGMGGLVQPSEDLGTDRQYPTCRGRSPILCRAGTASIGRVTQTKQPPANPGRFTPKRALSLCANLNLILAACCPCSSRTMITFCFPHPLAACPRRGAPDATHQSAA